jgi:hypothetical protein
MNTAMQLKEVKFDFTTDRNIVNTGNYALFSVFSTSGSTSNGNLTFYGDVQNTGAFFVKGVPNSGTRTINALAFDNIVVENGRTMTLVNERGRGALRVNVNENSGNVVCSVGFDISSADGAQFTYTDGSWYCSRKRLL